MIYLEIFGYIGTALVLLSMMMTKLSMLRIFNICGSVISAAYSYLSDAMPVVLLNLGLIVINLIHLVMEGIKKKQFNVISKDVNDEVINAFLEKNCEDIKKRFPDLVLNIGNGSKIYMVYSGKEPVGIFVGGEENGDLRISFGYSAPGYKYGEVVMRFMTELKNNGGISEGSEILMPYKISI
ncbi:MAG: hypothetical protein J6D09_05860 [Clostridia bacterium]|nr:hypothetical protein [Clostridia bacterium]